MSMNNNVFKGTPTSGTKMKFATFFIDSKFDIYFVHSENLKTKLSVFFKTYSDPSKKLPSKKDPGALEVCDIPYVLYTR